MFRRFDEFKLHKKKTQGNKKGAFYLDENGEEWLIKEPGDFNAVREAFAGALFTLLTRGVFSPETCLVLSDRVLKVASKIHPKYTQFNQIPFDQNVEEPSIDRKNIGGLEFLIIISIILSEGDFYGNGNIGIDLDQIIGDRFAAFRIDFDATFQSTTIKDINEYDTLGEMLDDLGARDLHIPNLLNKNHALEAIEFLSIFDLNQFDELFVTFKSYFKIAMQNEVLKVFNLINELPPDDDYLKSYYLSLVDAYGTKRHDLKAMLYHIKNKISALSERLIELEGINTPVSAFFNKEDFNVIPHEVNKVKKFFKAYDKIYVSLFKNFSSRYTQKLVWDIKNHGLDARSVIEMQRMIEKLRQLFENDEHYLNYHKNYLNQLRAHPDSYPNFEKRIQDTKKAIAKYSSYQERNENIKKIINEAQEAVEKINEFFIKKPTNQKNLSLK